MIAERCAPVGLLVHLQQAGMYQPQRLPGRALGGTVLGDPHDLLAIIWTRQVWITSSRPVDILC